jgi:hypothetical protein
VANPSVRTSCHRLGCPPPHITVSWLPCGLCNPTPLKVPAKVLAQHCAAAAAAIWEVVPPLAGGGPRAGRRAVGFAAAEEEEDDDGELGGRFMGEEAELAAAASLG